jgi:energy-coupling factor transport system ATP-binding protein
VIELRGVRYAYPGAESPALNGVDLRVEAGKVVAVVGPNGAGKSTLCYAIAGFVPHYFQGTLEGTVAVDGRDTVEHPLGELVKHCGLVFHNPLNQISGARFTVREELAFGLENLGTPRDEMQRRIDAVLDALNIESLADRSPFELSGGQQQRVALASILVMGPRVLLLDEPTAQLDPLGTVEVLEAISALRAQGTTVVLVEHKPEMIAEVADAVVVLHEGRVVKVGTPHEVLADPLLPQLGVGVARYTEAAREGSIRGLWPAALPLPVRIEEAVEGWRLSAERRAQSAEQGSTTDHRPPTNDQPALPQSAIPHRSAPSPSPYPRSHVSISIGDVMYRYPSGVVALDGVSLQIAAGETVALLGQNGAGKTTLARHLNGLLQPTSGMVQIGDWTTASHTVAQLAARVGYVFQHPDQQIFKRTVREEVAFGPRNLGFDAARMDAAIERALAATHLSAFADRHPHDLLLSQRKAVAIASVLAMETPVVVLDEPTTGQDALGVRMVGAIIDGLVAEGRTVVVITHDIDFCADHCRRCVVMRAGKVVLDGPTEEVWRHGDTLHAAAIEPPQLARVALALGLPPVSQVAPFLDLVEQMRGE